MTFMIMEPDIIILLLEDGKLWIRCAKSIIGSARMRTVSTIQLDSQIRMEEKFELKEMKSIERRLSITFNSCHLLFLIMSLLELFEVLSIKMVQIMFPIKAFYVMNYYMLDIHFKGL